MIVVNILAEIGAKYKTSIKALRKNIFIRMLESTSKKYLDNWTLPGILECIHTTYFERRKPTGNVIQNDIKYAAT